MPFDRTPPWQTDTGPVPALAWRCMGKNVAAYILSTVRWLLWQATLILIRPRRSVWSTPHNAGTFFSHRLCTFRLHASITTNTCNAAGTVHTTRDWIHTVNYNRGLLLLWHFWLGVRKSIGPVQIEWWGVGVVICLEQTIYTPIPHSRQR